MTALPSSATLRVGRGDALVVAAHAGDEAFGCAGAILRHLEAGERVSILVVSADAAGAEESRAAARLLRAPEPVVLGSPVDALRYGEPLVAELARMLARAAPALVYLPSPEEADAARRAVATSGREALRRTGGAARLVGYEIEAPIQPDLLLDVTAVLERKAEALRCFASRLRARPGCDDKALALARFRTITLPPEVRAAEAYRIVEPGELAGRARSGRADVVGLSADEAPLVSIVVRSSARSTLEAALDSVAAQTYPRIEIVLVEATAQRCTPPPHRFPIEVVAPGRTLRRSEAGNAGLERARGQYLMLLDDDDWLYPDHVATLVAALADERLGRAAYAGIEAVEPESSRVVHTYDEPFDAIKLCFVNYIPLHAMLFARSLFEEGCRLDPALDLFEDWDLWLQLAERTSIRSLPRVSAAYRMPGASAAHGDDEAVRRGLRPLWTKWLARWPHEVLLEVLLGARRAHEAHVRATVALRGSELAVAAASTEARARGAEVEELTARLAARDERLAELLESYSWRVTAPMRSLLDVARSLGPRHGGR